MKKPFKIQFIIVIILGIFCFYLGNRMVGTYNSLHMESDSIARTSQTLLLFLDEIKENPIYLDLSGNALLGGGFLLFIVLGVSLAEYVNRDKKHMKGIEHGSAKWGRRRDIAPFIDEDQDNNIILTKTEYLTMNSRMKNPEYNRNKNVIVVGSSGSGKTRNFIKPNLMQCGKTVKTSFVVTDPKGSIIHECGKMLEEEGYKIKCFNLIEYDKSDHYNPFHYIRNEIDILSLIENLIANTDGGDERMRIDFWAKSEKALLSALIGYVYFYFEKENQNFDSVLQLLIMANVIRNKKDQTTALDELFKDLKTQTGANPFVTEQYEIFKSGAGETIKSIIISVGVRLAPFTMPTIKDLVSIDTLELEKID